MQPFTAGEVNASVAQALVQFHRNAGQFGPEFQNLVAGILWPRRIGMGDAGDPFSDPLVQLLPDLSDFTPAADQVAYNPGGNAFPTISSNVGFPTVTAGLPYVSPTQPNVAASAATASPTLTSTLNQLVGALNTSADSLIKGTTAFFNAKTQLNNIQAASAAGVPVDVYTATKAGTNTATFTLANLFGGSGGIVPLLVVGGLAVFLISGERRRR